MQPEEARPRLAAELGVPLLGRVPLTASLRQAADAGVPHVIDEIADIARTIDEHRVGGFTRTLPLVS